MSTSKNKPCPRYRHKTIAKNCYINKNVDSIYDEAIHNISTAMISNELSKRILFGSDEKNDPVSHPSHYQSKNGLEVIDVINAFTDDLEGMEAVCTANILKYVCRWKKKNGAEDLKKAIWYAEYLVNYIQQSEKENKEETNNE